MYTMDINEHNNTFVVTASGFFSAEEVKEFINVYKRKVTEFDPTKYTLIINAEKLKPSAPDVLQLLTEVIYLYRDVPFKKKLSIIQSSITRMQLRRIGGVAFEEGVEFVNSLEEALSKI